MTPFQQFRVWFRNAPAGERTTAVIAALISVTLIGWLTMPVESRGSRAAQSIAAPAVNNSARGSTESTGEPARGAAGSVGQAGAVGGTGTGGAAGGLRGLEGSRGAGGAGGPANMDVGRSPIDAGPGSATSSHCPTEMDQGVTATQINVAVTLVNVAGATGNAALGVPSPAEQQQDYQQVADSINASGGAACRKLALSFYTVNPVDSSDAQQKCLQIAASHPFIATDVGALTDVGASDCIPAQKIPLVSTFLTPGQLKNYYPYYISPSDILTDSIRNGTRVWNQKGYFSPTRGFRKIGWFYHTCLPESPQAQRQAFHDVGLQDSQIVAYNLGCPPGSQSSPADYEQAVLAFKNAGVTTVTETGAGDYNNFTKIAAQQSFKPQYLFDEDGAAAGYSGALAPDPNNLDGAVAILGQRWGEANTPGYAPDAASTRCNAIFAKQGRPPIYQQPDGFGGVACFYLWFVAALLNHAPRLQRNALVAGLHNVGALDGPYPYGPVDFSAVPAGTPFGREGWRVDQFFKSCACWRVVDSSFHAPLA